MLHQSKWLPRKVRRQITSITAVVLALICSGGNRSSMAGDDPEKDWVQTKHNLQGLSLAMHNYHEAHGHFPPAVVIGPDGKTPHSWRVELLPFLEQQRLYEQYRMDEPWDSRHNQVVLRNIPDVFHSPHDDPKSTNSGYYVFVGPGTVFEGPTGLKISDITDGTSNTLMIIEAKQGIPWTKPADISFDRKQPAPEFKPFVKGQAPIALSDGSVRWLDLNKHKAQLNSLIIRNDGNIIDLR